MIFEPGQGKPPYPITPISSVDPLAGHVDDPGALILHPAQPPHHPQTGIVHPKNQASSEDTWHTDPSTAHYDVSHLPELVEEAHELQVQTTPENPTQAVTSGTISHQTATQDGDPFATPLPDEAAEFDCLPVQLDTRRLADEYLADGDFGSFDYLPEYTTDECGPCDTYSASPGPTEDSPGKTVVATSKDDVADDGTAQQSYPSDPFSEE
ncbi:hypothetical protein ACGFYU_02850 [Streptomyces sp. NPDC048337]|uniref:hypothetical protein n=1 Tax=Streptomyces sp. NPDC048337 TaxID=3365535 RepID=UPI00371C5A1A